MPILSPYFFFLVLYFLKINCLFSSIMVSNLTIGDTNTTFDGNTAIIIMTLPMFDLTADWELGVNFTLFG